MLRPRSIRRFAATAILALAGTLCATAQISNLPANQPTAQVAPLSGAPPQTDAARARRAEVRYADGLLSINANNSSLNQILREISRQTGMKITGGVREERVFGHYGPAAPADILATLIDGTATNMVLRQTASAAPEELILTPRGGGASPPNPNAPGFDSGDDDERPADRPNITFPPRAPLPEGPQQRAPAVDPDGLPNSIPRPANNVNGNPNNVSPTASTLPVTNSVPLDTVPTPSTTPSTNGIVDAPNPPDPNTVNPADPNAPAAAKTPQQVYEQLQQLRQQQQRQSTTPQ